MTQLSTTFKNSLARLLALNEAIPGFGDTNGLQPSAADGNLYIRLCTDAVVVDDDTIGTECAFTGYTAGGFAIARGTGGSLSVTGNVISNISDLEITVDAGYGGSENAKYAELWLNDTGNTEAERISHCPLSQVIEMVAGKTLKIAAGSLTFTID